MTANDIKWVLLAMFIVLVGLEVANRLSAARWNRRVKRRLREIELQRLQQYIDSEGDEPHGI